MTRRPEIHVGDHAVVRWLERREGYDLEPLRAAIRTDPASGGFTRDKVVVRALRKHDPAAYSRARAAVRRHAEQALGDQGLDTPAGSVDIGDGWRLALSPHPNGVSVATVIGPDMEYGDPVRPWEERSSG